MQINSLLLSQEFRGANVIGFSLLFCIVFSLSLFSGDVFPANNEIDAENAASSESAVTLDFRDGRLSVSASQVPIVELLQLVGDRVGFDVIAYGDFSDHSVSLTFSDLPPAEAVKKLLLDTSAIVSYGKAADPGKQPPISKIFLLGIGTAQSSPIRINTLESGLQNSQRLDEIQSSDAESRIASIERTEGFSDEITLENLAFALQHDPDPEVRLKAITALEKIGGSSAVDVLESGLGDQQAEVREKLVQTLGSIDDERIPLWLGQVLMSDPSEEVRRAAVESLARKDSDTARVFLEAATEDGSSLVSEAALRLSR